jgi:hypothetical protein
MFPDPHFDQNMFENFTDKDFIIFPINDAYTSQIGCDTMWSHELHETTGGPERVKHNQGHHWSAIAVDCRGDVLQGYYFDFLSNTPDRSENLCISKHLLMGVALLLNKDENKFNLSIAPPMWIDGNAPSQSRRDNTYAFFDGGNACGPFVWLIAKELTQYIVEF